MPRPPLGPAGVLAALACACALALPAPVVAQAAHEVQVTPETMTLTVGQRQPIFAAAYDRQGNLIASAKFAFRSSDTAIARVSGDGAVQGIAPGLAKIEARLQGRRASVAVLITGAAAGQAGAAAAGTLLTLDPATAVLLPGESIRLTPQALSQDSTPPVLGQVIWNSLKPEVATVDSAGVVLGVSPGKSIVQASTAAGLMATAPVDVEPSDIALAASSGVLGPEEAETLHVRVPAQNNREITEGLHWRSADTSVAVVGPTGVVQARGPGRTEIAVLGFGQERRTPLLVHRLPQTLVVSPKPVAEAIQVPLAGTRQFSAVAEAADSTPIQEAKIAWALADSVHAGFDPATGVLTALDTGTTTLTARLRGFEPVVWHVQVVPGLLGLDRRRLALRPGERTTLGATLAGAGDTILGPPAGVEWSSDRPEVASVAAGEVRGMSPGHAVVTATAPWGARVAADVYVTADLVVASNRAGAFGLYQVRADSPDSLLPLLIGGGANIQGVRSPDRTRIAFSSNRGGSYDLYVMDADGRNARRITADAGAEGEPVWTRDGSRIIYVAAPPGGVPQLVSIRPDGTDPVPLTHSAGGNRAPDVSPDGRRIAFVSTRDGNPELYEMDVTGGEARRLTKGSDRESSPRYLPSGDLLFVVAKGGGARLMRLPAGAASAMPLLRIDQPVVALDVSRDGERIAYVAGKLADAGKGKSKLTLRIQALAAGSTPLLVPLRPGEQVLSPSF
ncbi:MAG TPA: Ig-like domain-containing protein [Gemmatimonadales bacterium]|nr:Ig-like domain-containing protein [Gemmatimonadales bacterium]